MKTIVSMCAIAAMTFSVAAWADKPEQTPMSWTEVGSPAFDCGDFFILYDLRLDGYERDYFNSDGSISRILFHFAFRDTVYYNSNDPSYWLAGTAEHQNQWVYFKDGAPVLYAPVGPILRVIVPGYGPVAMATGRWIYDIATQELVFNSNPHNGEFHYGDMDAFCAALRP